MNNDVKLSTFPTNRVEALALIYCHKHANADTTPKELAEMFEKAKEEIRETLKKSSKSKVDSTMYF